MGQKQGDQCPEPWRPLGVTGTCGRTHHGQAPSQPSQRRLWGPVARVGPRLPSESLPIPTAGPTLAGSAGGAAAAAQECGLGSLSVTDTGPRGTGQAPVSFPQMGAPGPLQAESPRKRHWEGVQPGCHVPSCPGIWSPEPQCLGCPRPHSRACVSGRACQHVACPVFLCQHGLADPSGGMHSDRCFSSLPGF